jgi:hypothetical protein
MINSMNITKPSGSASIQCDAGTPMSGRTGNTGTYEILNLLPGGAIPTGANITANYVNPPIPIALPPGGALGVNVIIGVVSSVITILENGLYNLQPFVLFTSSTGAGSTISIILTNATSNLSAYALGLVPYTDTFNPNNIQLSGVDSGYSYGPITLETYGTASRRSNINANQMKNYYYNAGTYNAILVARAAFSVTSPNAYFGFEVAQRIC